MNKLPKRLFLFFATTITSGVLLGILGAYSDKWYSDYQWTSVTSGQSNIFVGVLVMIAALLGNAAGAWAILALVAGVTVARKSHRQMFGVLASLLFMATAIVSYYAAIALFDLRSSSVALSEFMFRWLVVAVIVGVVSGVAGSWLALSTKLWQRVAGGVVLIGYVGLDVLGMIISHRSEAAALIVLVLYTGVALALLKWLCRSWRVVGWVVVVAGVGLAVLGLSWPVINSMLLEIQHG